MRSGRRSIADYVLLAEVEYSGWTHTGTLRHPSFKGLREPDDRGVVCVIDDTGNS